MDELKTDVKQVLARQDAHEKDAVLQDAEFKRAEQYYEKIDKVESQQKRMIWIGVGVFAALNVGWKVIVSFFKGG